MKILILAISIVFLASNCQAFEVGNFKWTNFLELYAHDGLLTEPLTDQDVHGTTYRVEWASRLKYKPWPGYLKFKWYGDFNEDFSNLERNQIKGTYVHPIYKMVYGLAQYTYSDVKKKTYKKTARVGVGLKF